LALARALREIRHYQQNVGTLIPRLRFARLVRQIAEQIWYELAPGVGGLRFSVAALAAIQETAEASLVFMFEMSNRLAIHGKRITVMPRDVHLFREFVDAMQPDNYLSTKQQFSDAVAKERREKLSASQRANGDKMYHRGKGRQGAAAAKRKLT
jgi:histone H3/H4